MAIDKAVDSGVLDTALTYTANRIRAKTGSADQIAWDAVKGFGDAVDAVQAGGGDILIESGTIDLHTGAAVNKIILPVSDDSFNNYLVILNATASWLQVDDVWTKQDGITFDGVSAVQFPCIWLVGVYPAPAPRGWTNGNGTACTPTSAQSLMTLRIATTRTDSAYEAQTGPITVANKTLTVNDSYRPFCHQTWGLTFSYQIVGWNNAE